jgi:hypothetical protein
VCQLISELDHKMKVGARARAHTHTHRRHDDVISRVFAYRQESRPKPNVSEQGNCSLGSTLKQTAEASSNTLSWFTCNLFNDVISIWEDIRRRMRFTTVNGEHRKISPGAVPAHLREHLGIPPEGWREKGQWVQRFLTHVSEGTRLKRYPAFTRRRWVK